MTFGRMLEGFSRRFALLLFPAALHGCASASAPPRGTPPGAPAAQSLPRAPERPEDAEWGRIRVAALGLELALPEANAWQAKPSQTWARFWHEPSESALELRLMRAERLARPEDCETRARLERPDLPRAAAEEAVDQRRVSVPQGFVSIVTVTVESVADGGVSGHATAFAATIGKCLSFHFATRADGQGSESEVARRLGLAVERVLPSVVVLGVEARVRPEPPR